MLRLIYHLRLWSVILWLIYVVIRQIWLHLPIQVWWQLHKPWFHQLYIQSKHKTKWIYQILLLCLRMDFLLLYFLQLNKYSSKQNSWHHLHMCNELLKLYLLMLLYLVISPRLILNWEFRMYLLPQPSNHQSI